VTRILLRLGSGDYSDGHKAMYAVLEDKRVVDISPAVNDDSALAHARELSPDIEVACEPALEPLARRRGATMRPLTTFEKTAKANLAVSMFAPTTYRGVKDGEALRDFFAAAKVFAQTVADDTRPQWNVAATIRGTVVNTEIDREVFFLVVPGAEPQLIVMSQTDARWIAANDAEVTDVDRMAIVFRSKPGELATIVEEAYGLRTIPEVTIIDNRQPRSPDSEAFELLAGCMGAIGRFVAAKAPGIFYEPLLGGELDIKLSTFRE
jgi:hypothetical protein